MQADFKTEMRLIEEIERDIPTSLLVGLFAVDTMAVRKALVEKHQAIGKATLSLIAGKVKERAAQVHCSPLAPTLAQPNSSLTTRIEPWIAFSLGHVCSHR